MTDLITQVAAFIEMLVLTVGYPGIFLTMFVENLFPPVPTDPFMPYIGLLASQGQFNFVTAWLAAICGAVIGSLVLYGIGAWAGERLIRELIRRYGRWLGVNEHELDRALELFNRYGPPMVLIGRLLPLLRSVVPLTAGVSRMSLWKFIPLTALSTALSAGGYMTIGYHLGENWQEILAISNRFGPAMMLGGAMMTVAVAFWWLRRANRRREEQEIRPDVQ